MNFPDRSEKQIEIKFLWEPGRRQNCVEVR